MAKLNILIGFFIIAITMVFVVQVFGFLNNSFRSIDSKKNDIFCSKSDFDINIFEGEKNMVLEVSSFSVNISKITLASSKGKIVTYFDPVITKGSSRNLLLNTTPGQDYYFYINECNSTGIKK